MGPLRALQGYARSSDEDEACFVFWCGTEAHVVVVRPELVQELLLNTEGKFQRQTELVKELFREGLLASEGARWKKHRKILKSPFRMECIRDAVPAICMCCEKMLADWKRYGNNPFGPNREFSNLMLAILGEVAFGVTLDLPEARRREMHRALVLLTTEVVRRHFSPFPTWTISRRRTRKAAQTLSDLTDEIIARGEHRLAGHETEGVGNLLDLLLWERNGGALSTEDVRDEVLGILIAGHETSATALSWVVAMLAKHPEVQQQARAEVDRELVGRAPASSDIDRLEYLTQVIQETLRLYPSVPFSIHRAAQDISFGGYFLPKGTRIDLSSYLIHRDPRAWEKPDEFDPNRFSHARARKIPAYQYFPFLKGPHGCIGMNLALTELKIAAAMLLQRFELAPYVGALKENIRVSLHPSGLEIALLPRDVARHGANAQVRSNGDVANVIEQGGAAPHPPEPPPARRE